MTQLELLKKKYSTTDNLIGIILCQLKKYETAIDNEIENEMLVDEIEAVNQLLLQTSIALGKKQETIILS